MDEKIYKAGTVIKITMTCNFVGCDAEEEFTLPDDMTEKEINEMVYDMTVEYVQPEGYFKVKSEPQ